MDIPVSQFLLSSLGVGCSGKDDLAGPTVLGSLYMPDIVSFTPLTHVYSVLSTGGKDEQNPVIKEFVFGKGSRHWETTSCLVRRVVSAVKVVNIMVK